MIGHGSQEIIAMLKLAAYQGYSEHPYVQLNQRHIDRFVSHIKVCVLLEGTWCKKKIASIGKSITYVGRKI